MRKTDSSLFSIPPSNPASDDLSSEREGGTRREDKEAIIKGNEGHEKGRGQGEEKKNTIMSYS